ncbi:C-type mannose receptor 2-like [Amphiura filiformis]|uniref:C-type mannose receptor 2-like n=1 Tax=Amphiura filiformis TaxID=82378 RepID=UPI003B215007
MFNGVVQFFHWVNPAKDEESYRGWLWRPNEPNGGVFENCGLIERDNVHGLSDANCLRFEYFICEDDNNPCTAEINYSPESCDITGRYAVYFSPSTWQQARDYCVQQGRVLASLSDEAEVRYIRLGILKLDPLYNAAAYWVGLNDITTEGSWVWEGHPEMGVEFDVPIYGRWNPFEPNGGPTENCVELKIPPEGGLRGYNDVGCQWAKSFICEIKCQQRDFTVDDGFRLLNHALYSVQVSKLSRCTAACLKDKACQSVNLIPTGTAGAYACEINTLNQEEATGGDYVAQEGGIYAGTSGFPYYG